MKRKEVMKTTRKRTTKEAIANRKPKMLNTTKIIMCQVRIRRLKLQFRYHSKSWSDSKTLGRMVIHLVNLFYVLVRVY